MMVFFRRPYPLRYLTHVTEIAHQVGTSNEQIGIPNEQKVDMKEGQDGEDVTVERLFLVCR